MVMNLKNLLRSCLCFFLLLSMLIGYLPMGALPVKAQDTALSPTQEDTPATRASESSVTLLGEGESLVPTWPEITRHYQVAANPTSALNDVSYTYMSCMTAINDHAYYVRTTEDRNNAIMARTNLKSGGSATLTVDGNAVVTTFGEAKALDGITIGKQHYLFLATGRVGGDSILLLSTPGSGAVTTKATFGLKAEDGTALGVDRLTILSAQGNEVTLLIRCAWNFYTVTIDVTAASSIIAASFAFGLNSSITTSMAKTIAGIPDSYPVSDVGKVNLTGMDYDNDRLYVSVIVDCCSIVLVYDHIAELIASHPNDALPNTDLCIRSSSSGYESYRIQDMSVYKGVIYYCNRVRWITSGTYRGGICHFTQESSPRSDIMEGFRECGIYLLQGTQDTDFVVYNPKSADGQLHVLKYSGLASDKQRDAYFALETDTQGYWYIRSLSHGYNYGGTTDNSRVSKYYITANEDGSVSLAPLEEGNNRQRWYLRATTSPHTTDKVFAIHNKETGLNLNNVTQNGKAVLCTNEIGKTYFLKQLKVCSNPSVTIDDLLFDYEFYTAAYPETAGMTEAQAKEHYKNTGKKAGYLPSILFDPQYYLDHNSDVKKHATYGTFEGAYKHFVNYGFWEGRQGSVFFSVSEYASRGPLSEDNYDYYNQGSNDDLYGALSYDKLHLMQNYILYGADENAIKEHRAGSDDFDLKEFNEEFKLLLTKENGYAALKNYVASLIRFKNCKTKAELESFLFDAAVYSLDPAVSEDKLASFSGNTYEDKLHNHWVNFGRKEGRTASMFFSAPYYTSRYPDEVKNLADGYNYFVTTGFEKGQIGSEYVAMGLDPENLCRHEQTATALFPSCIAVCERIEFCASCKTVVHRESSPALPHVDADSNSLCDLCNNTITEALRSQNHLLALPTPVPNNELVTDVSGFKHKSEVKPEGTYYMVQKNRDGIYRVLNPLTQTNLGTIAATQVFDMDGAILGADPDMGVEIYFAPGTAGNTEKTNHYHFKIEGDYFLGIRNGDNPLVSDQLQRKSAGINIAVTPNTDAGILELARNIKDVNNPSKDNSTYYLCLEQRLGMEHFEWSYSVNYRQSEDVFYLYRLLEDRLYTESLYATLQKAVSYVPYHSLYQEDVHGRFLSILAEAVNLYKSFNGISLPSDTLAQKDLYQSLLDQKERQLLDLISILSINAENNEGKTISYFSATMYNWNEDNMNALVKDLEESETKGFYFENANNKDTPASPFSDYDKETKEDVNGVSTYAQMYSIYSGLAAPDLYKANNPPFHNENVVAADFWSTKAIKDAKEVYTDVRIPFIHDQEGYYILDSDANGVFFEEEPASGATLAILDKPMSYYWSGGTSYGVGVPGYHSNNPYSHRPSNGYATAFQPFAKPTTVIGTAYPSSASNFSVSAGMDSYIMDGVALVSGPNPTVQISGRGTPTWGFGMQLNVDFQMTEDGNLYGDPNRPITFSFSGDDDVWIYIDSKLVMELGGSHDALQGQINFATGEVTVTSDKYDRIRDKNTSGYGHGSDATQYGNGITENGSILDGVPMRQKNIYDKVFKQSVAEFSAAGMHTLSIFYMDRGKGRTNCAMKFNLPQSDTIVAEKNIAPYYGKEDGTLTDTLISDSTMAYLNTLDFGYTLTTSDNNHPVSFQQYRLYDRQGVFAGDYKTDIMGRFTLKNGYRAEFINFQFNGQSYLITEESRGPRWGQVSWTGRANGTPLASTIGYHSPTAAVTGDQYASETISYACTNTYIYNPELVPEELVIVMDYGKSIDIAVIDDAVFNGISELVAREGKLTSLDVTQGAGYANAAIRTDNRTVRVSLKKLLEGAFKFNAHVELYLDDGTLRNVTIPVTVLPATIMYYETDMINPTALSQVFHRYVKNPKSDDYLWKEVTSDTKATLQDSGEVGDIVYKPVIDKEFIPSNAFFVDFDGKGYMDRYSVDPIYKGNDFDAGNWIARYVEGTNYTASCTYDTAAGTMTLPVKKGYNADATNTVKQYGPEFHTGTLTDTYSTDAIQYRYSAEDYAEIRFKMDGCTLADGQSSPVAALCLRYFDENNQFVQVVVYSPFTLQNGAWQTVTFDFAKLLSKEDLKKLSNATVVTIGIRFQHILQADASVPGSVTVDYLYVGPQIGWLDSVDSDYLLFSFDGTAADQLRYGTAPYGYKDFDIEESNPSWAVSHGTGNFAIHNLDGTLSYGVTANPSNTSICGPRIMTTGKANTIPTNSGGIVADTAILNFDLRSAEYIQIRFKLENCEWSKSDPLKQVVFLYNYRKADGTEAYGEDIRVDYDGTTEEYQTIRVPLISSYKIKKEGVTLTNLGVRFRSIIGKNNTPGKVIIDQLFIGSEEAMLRLDRQETGMFFDFDNTEADRSRYTGSVYGGFNFDDPVNRHWGMSYGGATKATGNVDPENKNRLSFHNGTIRLNICDKPYNDQTRFGTSAIAYTEGNEGYPAGYYPWNTNPDRMPLSFPSNSADYVQIRFRVQDCELIEGSTTANIGVIFYYQNQAGSIDYIICNSSAYEITDDFITLTFSTKNKLDISETVLGFGVAFRYLKAKKDCEATAAVYVDYLYIGQMHDSTPTADALFIGFDNMDEDRDRYASKTYGYINPDEEDPQHWWINPGKVESLTIDNNLGVAEMVAVPELPLLDSSGAPEFPDLYMVHSRTATSHKPESLNFRPDRAELYQIRFKLENLAIGTTINEDGTERKIGPYVKLQWIPSNTSNQAATEDASQKISLPTGDLSSGKWITVTAKIPEQARNLHSIMSIRPYFGGMESISGKQGKITIDYIYIGPDDRPDQVYGYDSHYTNDTTLSDGHSYVVEGSGVKLNESTETYTEVSFSFKGTGFDIISRTGPKQATIRVEVWKDGAAEPAKRMTVNNKGELELYQIPVVSVQGLPYGSYTVKLWVNSAIDSQYDFLKRGGEFHFDAVRIYDPMNRGTATDPTALAAYKLDRESYNHIKEIRNILLTKDAFESLTDSVEGAVFVDVNSSNVDPNTGKPTTPSTDYITADVQTYNKIGPKNEIYLAPGQAVAFNLQVSTNRPIASLDIGAKAIVKCTTNLKVGILAKDAQGDYVISSNSTFTIKSATAQYWPLDLTDIQFKSTETGEYQPMYLIFYNVSSPGNNSGKNVISLTDLKVAYQLNPSGSMMDDAPNDPEIVKRNAGEAPPVTFLVDDNTLPAARHFVRAINETPIADADAKLGHSLNLASDIAINYIIRKSDLEQYDTFALHCSIPVYEDGLYVGDRAVTLSPVDKGEYWYFTLEGLTAVQMMDEVSAKLVMTAGGRTYYSATDTYSIARYAITQLNKTDISPALRALCANLLRYGAKAQIFKGYRTNTLADRDMTAEHRALLTDADCVPFGSTNRVDSTLSAPQVTWTGKSLVLDTKVTLRFVVALSDPTLAPKDLTLRIRYTDNKGVTKEAFLTQPTAYGNTYGWYSFTFDGLLASELRTVLTATVYCGDTPVSDTLYYSVDTYGNNKTGTLLDLCKALFAYSDSARAYFS